MNFIKKHAMLAVTLGLCLGACKNREVNEGERFQPREIHEDIIFHFDKITVDGIEYLILERDNNNPHEGFGFMAFRANKLMEKQDTVLAYLKTVNEMQVRMYAALKKIPLEKARGENLELFESFLKEEKAELESLQKAEFSSQGKPERNTESN